MSIKRRRTKIIATVGPACQSRDAINGLISVGVDVFRLNFSHGNAAGHAEMVSLIRECSARCKKEVGIIADLQGPKLRIASFRQAPIHLKAGDKFRLDSALAEDAGDQHQVGVSYKALANDVSAGDTLLLNDGLIELLVEKVHGTAVDCRVMTNGVLSSNKGINRLGGGLSAPSLTHKDKEDLIAAVKMGVDYIAVSFVRSASDIHAARQLIDAAGGHQSIIAKIERTEAVTAMDEIIRAAEAVMVARGDLGVEIGQAEVPAVQKQIINRARALDSVVITATQMMESMVNHPIPTRAEVSDVANAVLDGTDAVMLSAETAIGDHPVKVVETMGEICVTAERHPIMQQSGHRMECRFTHIDEAIAMATMYTANHLGIEAIIALTESGATPLWMSRIRSGIPIYGLSRHVSTQRKMTLYRGVYSIDFDPTQVDRRNVNRLAIELLHKMGIVVDEDLVILTKGHHMGHMGGTNAMRILRVGAAAPSVED